MKRQYKPNKINGAKTVVYFNQSHTFTRLQKIRHVNGPDKARLMSHKMTP